MNTDILIDGEWARPDALLQWVPYDDALPDDCQPELVVLNYEDDVILQRQLNSWCWCQRYRYYVLSEPVVSDGEYDAVEKYLNELEETADYLRRGPRVTQEVGSCRRQDYPRWIRSFFPLESYPVNPRKKV